MCQELFGHHFYLFKFRFFTFHVLSLLLSAAVQRATSTSAAPCRPQRLPRRTHREQRSHCGRVQWSEQGSVCSQSPSSGDLLAALAVTEPLVTPLTSRWTVTIVSKLLTDTVSSAGGPVWRDEPTLNTGRRQANEQSRCSVGPTSR